MGKLKLINKQPGSHAYKDATAARLDIPNVLDREFNISAPNEIWYGNMTYIWAQGRWTFLAKPWTLAMFTDCFAAR